MKNSPLVMWKTDASSMIVTRSSSHLLTIYIRAEDGDADLFDEGSAEGSNHHHRPIDLARSLLSNAPWMDARHLFPEEE